jgi:hypothetical protein
VSFPWLISNLSGSPEGAKRRLDQATRDLRDRAALFARLGYTAAAATQRLQARVAWDHETTTRPGGLSDAAIAQLVTETFARHAPR